MSFSYDTVSYLGVPLCVTGEDGSYLFENQAMRDRLPVLCRPAARRALQKEGREILASLSQGEGCFLTCAWRGQIYPFFAFRCERDYGRFFFSALTAAMPLLSGDEAARAPVCLAEILDGMLRENQDASETAFYRIADAHFPETVAVAIGSSVTEMACQLLLGTGCLISEVGEGYVIREPRRFFAAVGQVLCRLMTDADEGIAPSVILTNEGDGLMFVLPDTVIAAGGCRVLAVAEHPEAFYFRREEMSAALCLAAAAELVRSDKR